VFLWDLAPLLWTRELDIMQTFKGRGAQVRQRRVPAPYVVPALDVLEDISPGLGPRVIPLPLYALGLQRMEKALHHGVVGTGRHRTHTAVEPLCGELRLIRGIAVLTPPIRVMQQPGPPWSVAAVDDSRVWPAGQPRASAEPRDDARRPSRAPVTRDTLADCHMSGGSRRESRESASTNADPPGPADSPVDAATRSRYCAAPPTPDTSGPPRAVRVPPRLPHTSLGFLRKERDRFFLNPAPRERSRVPAASGAAPPAPPAAGRCPETRRRSLPSPAASSDTTHSG